MEPITDPAPTAGFPENFPFAQRLAEAGLADVQAVANAADEDLRKIPTIGQAAVFKIRAALAALNIVANVPPVLPTTDESAAEGADPQAAETQPADFGANDPDVVTVSANLLTPILPLLARNGDTGKLAEHLVITVSADDFVQVATRRKEDGYTEVVAIGDTVEEAISEAVPQLKKLKGWAGKFTFSVKSKIAMFAILLFFIIPFPNEVQLWL